MKPFPRSKPRILLNVFHPDLAHSTANKALYDAARGLHHVTCRDVYQEYPGMRIDAEREQHLLLEHDLLVFQHPLYWYSSPALLKEWQDCVLQPGFAFPPGVGDKLKGKHWLSVVTMGSSEEDYRAEGSNKYTISEFLRPFEQTVAFCSMNWLTPLVIDRVVPAKIVNGRRTTSDALKKQAERYRRYLEGF